MIMIYADSGMHALNCGMVPMDGKFRFHILGLNDSAPSG